MKSKTAIKLISVFLIAIFSVIILVGYTNANRKIPIYRVKTNEKQIAITFDCAWGGDKTRDIIEVLKENDIKATFFMVSFWAEKYPDLVSEISSQGSEIGNHSKTHPHFAKMSNEAVEEEIKISTDAIEEISKTDIKVFRAPFGEYTNEMIETCEKYGQQVIQWDVDTLDWKGISAKEIVSRITEKTTQGSIILMHNNSDNVVEAIKEAIPKLKAEGYEFVTVSELIYKEDYKIKSNGEQVSLI